MSAQMSYGLPRLTQQAVNLLQQIAPVSSTGQQTVVAKLAQAALPQMGMSPQAQGLGALAAPNPQMQPQAPGTVAQAAQAAGIAGQQQQAAQQQAMQQAMQMAQQQQQQPQMMARGGLASLPAENIVRMKYAQGGVIGFDGTERSDVPNPEEDREKLAKFLNDVKEKGLLPAGAAIADVAALIPRGLIGAYNSTVVRGMRAAGMPAAYLPDIAGGDPSSATPFYDRYVRQQQEKSAPAPVDYSGMDHPRVTPMLPPMPGRETRPAPAPRPSAAPAAAASAGPGLPSLLGNIAMPDMAANIKTAQSVLSEKPITEQEARIKQLLDMQNAMPPARQEELQALRDIQQRRLEARRQQAGEEGWDRFMAVMGGLGQRGLGGAGAAGAAFTAQQRAQTAQQLAEDEAHAQKISAITEAQNNQKVNALKTAVDEYGKTLTARGNFNTAVGNLVSHLYSTQGHITGAQIQAMAHIYSANVNRESQMLLRQTQIEANQLAKMESLIRASTHDYATVSKDIETQLEKKYGIYTSLFQNPEMMKKPENVEMYNKYLKDKTDMMRARLDPIQENINRVRQRVEGMDFGEPPPGAVKRKPGT